MTRSGYEQTESGFNHLGYVLIPLLVDDPLWVMCLEAAVFCARKVLIPLLVDDPLWEFINRYRTWTFICVLIPLLVDDPLWGKRA